MTERNNPISEHEHLEDVARQTEEVIHEAQHPGYLGSVALGSEIVVYVDNDEEVVSGELTQDEGSKSSETHAKKPTNEATGIVDGTIESEDRGSSEPSDVRNKPRPKGGRSGAGKRSHTPKPKDVASIDATTEAAAVGEDELGPDEEWAFKPGHTIPGTDEYIPGDRYKRKKAPSYDGMTTVEVAAALAQAEHADDEEAQAGLMGEIRKRASASAQKELEGQDQGSRIRVSPDEIIQSHVDGFMRIKERKLVSLKKAAETSDDADTLVVPEPLPTPDLESASATLDTESDPWGGWATSEDGLNAPPKTGDATTLSYEDVVDGDYDDLFSPDGPSSGDRGRTPEDEDSSDAVERAVSASTEETLDKATITFKFLGNDQDIEIKRFLQEQGYKTNRSNVKRLRKILDENVIRNGGHVRSGLSTELPPQAFNGLAQVESDTSG